MRKFHLVAKTRSAEKDTVFYVSKEHQGEKYYVKTVNKQTTAVSWTKLRRRAIRFHTQQAVYQYVHVVLNDRKDVTIVNAVEE